MAFDFGGKVSGDSSSTATQDTAVNFIPSVTGPSSGALVSAYPAGQGLATINSALPGSAAFLPTTYAAPSSSSSMSVTTLLLLAAAGAAAWWLLRRHR